MKGKQKELKIYQRESSRISESFNNIFKKMIKSNQSERIESIKDFFKNPIIVRSQYINLSLSEYVKTCLKGKMYNPKRYKLEWYYLKNGDFVLFENINLKICEILRNSNELFVFTHFIEKRKGKDRRKTNENSYK